MYFQLETELWKQCHALISYTGRNLKASLKTYSRRLWWKGRDIMEVVLAPAIAPDVDFLVAVNFPLVARIQKEVDGDERAMWLWVGWYYVWEWRKQIYFWVESAIDRKFFGEKKIVNQELEDLERLQVLVGINGRELRPGESWREEIIFPYEYYGLGSSLVDFWWGCLRVVFVTELESHQLDSVLSSL